MFEILTVCTGNICRSPLAAVILQTRLGARGAQVRSAGTHGLDAAPMTPEAQRLAVEHGVSPELAAAHRSRYLGPADLRSPDLLLAMSREHRRRVVETDPSRLRSAFTVREFARLAKDCTDDDVRDAAERAGADPSARVRAAIGAVGQMRGMSAPPADPADDDVIDPYRRSWATYQTSAAQLTPAIDQVVRVMSLAVPAR
ncbi:low molecular weight phosphatase family protein [uncultured Microbacterium sp.]|uniref:arsenate reductase/protein-tyrosine-phosphatase family protein n=1 Tax=uncultured Microbacterium sp. TaxID=191216 RepID=UPI0026051C70|nr:low molecular weight phosphatase family protein [uncultured Microbacterium sp.]